MRQHCCIILSALCLCSLPLPAQPGTAALHASDWVTVTSPGARSWTRLDFIDAVNGIIADDSTVYKTMDGGRTWTEITPEREGHPGIRAIDYVDTAMIAVATYGALYLSHTAGGSWMKQEMYLNDVSFYDAAHGAAGGGPASIFTTSDGGRTWTEVLTLAQRYPLESIVMPGPRLIVSSWTTPHPPGMFDGAFYRSADGGSSWTMLNLGQSYYPGRIVFGDSMHGLAAAYSQGGAILKTVDGGASWRECYRVPSGASVFSVSMPAGNDAAALVARGTIVRTTDGGTTWTSEEIPAGSRLRAIALLSTGVIWAVGDSGAILLRDPHATAVRASVARAPAGYELLQNYPNPFNPSTTIRFAIPFASRVTMRVYSAAGILVSTLVHDRLYGAGTSSVGWDASRESQAASGVFFVRMDAHSIDHPQQSFTRTIKLVYLR